MSPATREASRNGQRAIVEYVRGHQVIEELCFEPIGTDRMRCSCGAWSATVEGSTLSRKQERGQAIGAHRSKVLAAMKRCEFVELSAVDILPGDFHHGRRVKRVQLVAFPEAVIVHYEDGGTCELLIEALRSEAGVTLSAPPTVAIFRPRQRGN